MALTAELALKIERDLFEYLDKIKKEKGLTDKEWGCKAFEGENINSHRKIQNLKNPQVNGYPQRLNIGDFVRLSHALNKDPARVFLEILGQNKL